MVGFMFQSNKKSKLTGKIERVCFQPIGTAYSTQVDVFDLSFKSCGLKIMKVPEGRAEKKNKPDRAMMRPDCVSACIDFGAKHVTYMERQMDEKQDETTE